MNDPKQIKASILEREKRYIGLTENISRELIIVLAQTTPKIVGGIFKKSSGKGGQFHKHDVEIICSICNKHSTIEKATIAEVQLCIQNERDQTPDMCTECSIKIQKEYETRMKLKEQQWEKEQPKREQEHLLHIEKRTDDFIKIYLNPKMSWNKGTKQYHRLQELYRSSVSTKQEQITEYIKNMEYNDFLNTPYWIAIAMQVKYKAGFACSLCNSLTGLATHHKTYDRHGKELSYWKEDLICLCNVCHKKFHNK